MTLSEKYSPFLTWTPDDPATLDSITPAFHSLVSMVRDNLGFDEELLSKVSTFISSVATTVMFFHSFKDFLMAVGRDSINPNAKFVDSISVLVSSSHPSIFKATLSFIRKCLDCCSSSLKLDLVSSKLFPGILSSQNLQRLPLIADKSVMEDILAIFLSCIELLSTASVLTLSSASGIRPESIRDVVLREVLVPIEPSLVQISRNRYLFWWDDECKETFILLTKIFDFGPLHQPTHDFICSSCIPVVLQSLLSKTENESVRHEPISKLFSYILGVAVGWSQILAQRANIVANTGTGRVS
ncbi:hypothetical protein BLNAU_9386 [Blattamonas nauphoetae]|uniref:Uncharacterized protein n=1 Tax=Blattamonas nauphoetae TaxID=2049346 RepID=A0ABQ9XW58_9EUKA|nr:hypothetical protein BLNAU_9386 [Blattamonas nauphoetae]